MTELESAAKGPQPMMFVNPSHAQYRHPEPDITKESDGQFITPFLRIAFAQRSI
jgi:hypothetical protein